MLLDRVKYIVIYRPYREPSNSSKRYCLFNDAREAMSFSGTHSRYCSSIDTCKVDFMLTDSILQELLK